MSGTADEVQEALAAVADADDALFLQGFFKTGPGEYGAETSSSAFACRDQRALYRSLPRVPRNRRKARASGVESG